MRCAQWQTWSMRSGPPMSFVRPLGAGRGHPVALVTERSPSVPRSRSGGAAGRNRSYNLSRIEPDVREGGGDSGKTVPRRMSEAVGQVMRCAIPIEKVRTVTGSRVLMCRQGREGATHRRETCPNEPTD